MNVDCFEVKRTARLTEQATAAGISIDSALSLGLQAKEYATGLLLNNEVTIKRDSTEPNFDVYGRLLRHVFIYENDYSEMLKRKGLVAL